MYNDKENLNNETIEKDSKVGYKCPPKAHQFKPGCSGNPKGRPKGSKNLQEALLKALYADIKIVENGETKKVKVLDAIAKRMVSQAVGGDIKQIKELIKMFDSKAMQKEIKDFNNEKKNLAPPSPNVKKMVFAIRQLIDEKLTEEGHFDK